MKNNLLIFLFATLSLFCFSQQSKERSSWDFPIKPGMKEWKKLESHQAMVEVCQIPDNILPTLSTDELAKICLDYPLFFTMKAFNNLQEGFNQVSKEFNGFQELFKRDDAGSVLLHIYKTIKPEMIIYKETNLEKGSFIQQIFYLEFILAQNVIISKLNNEGIQELLKECMNKLDSKANYNFSTFSTQTTPLIMTRTLEIKEFSKYKIENQKSEKYKYFSNAVLLSDKNMIEEIKSLTLDYLKTIE